MAGAGPVGTWNRCNVADIWMGRIINVELLAGNVNMTAKKFVEVG